MDNTQELLKEILADLYKRQSSGNQPSGVESYVVAQDNQFLGKIVNNRYDNWSILNEYGPHGSRYSPASMFNEYSNYGSKYGLYSLTNPYCQQPPKLFINNNFKCFLSDNIYLSPRISSDVFFYNVKNNIDGLSKGHVIEVAAEEDLRIRNGESFIQAQDGTYLGSIVPNRYSAHSIFNSYGSYGSRYSSVSIFNRYSPYGSHFSNLSPYNRYTKTPPKVYANGKFVAYLTVNPYLKPSLNPDELMPWAEKTVNRYSK
jgi:hypothetical protein